MKKSLNSINQINAKIKTNAVIQMYYDLSERSYKRQLTEREYNLYIKGYVINKERDINYKRNLLGNYIFGQALYEFENIVSNKRVNNSYYGEIVEYQVISEYQCIDLRIRFYADMKTGVTCEIIPSYDFQRKSFCGIQLEKKFKVRSNLSYTPENLEIVAKKFIEQNLFKGGLLREMQLWYNLSKKEVLSRYKELKEHFIIPEYESKEKIEYIIKRLNKLGYKVASNMTNHEILKAFELYKDLPNKKGKKYIESFRCLTSDILEYFDGDIDELEEILHKEMKQNTLYI